MSSGRVLVVDDEQTILMALKIALEDAGLEAVTVLSAEEGIAQLREQAFDAMLFDKNLPGKSGVELTRMVRVENVSVPIVMMTGFGSAVTARETLNLGIDRYLEKPFPDLHDVPRIVLELLAAGRRRWLPDSGLFMTAGAAPQAPLIEPALQALVVSPDRALRSDVGEPIAIRNALVWQASTADEARALAEQHEPDLVVVHANEKEHWAVPLLRTLRQAAPDALFVVLATGDPPLAVLTDFIELGVGGLLEPVVDEEYTRRISELIQRLRLR